MRAHQTQNTPDPEHSRTQDSRTHETQNPRELLRSAAFCVHLRSARTHLRSAAFCALLRSAAFCDLRSSPEHRSCVLRSGSLRSAAFWDPAFCCVLRSAAFWHPAFCCVLRCAACRVLGSAQLRPSLGQDSELTRTTQTYPPPSSGRRLGELN